jgi:UDP-GlcNAc3NAcA epimerase
MKLLTVVGARPQFIKAAPICQVLRQSHDEVLVHTGQHYDQGMSDVFFHDLQIPEPDYNLGVGSGSHGQQTGQMLIGLEELMLQERPDWVIVYGDTNSTLAGAIAAAKLNIRLAHVEAGLRSFNRTMPEEINRILTDHAAQALFCPTRTAVKNLMQEGIHIGVHLVGDVMFDAMLHFGTLVDDAAVLSQFEVTTGDYVLATVHRAANTDDPERLAAILACLDQSAWQVLLPAHPRTRNALHRFRLAVPNRVTLIEPVGYLEMLALEKNARFIMTDSGGVQKEAYVLEVPCITLREETEWVETVTTGWNTLVGIDVEKTASALSLPRPVAAGPLIFGDGSAAEKIVSLLEWNDR